MEEVKRRTDSQRKSLEVYCRELASALSGAGVSMEVFVHDIEADHTQQSVKEVFRAFAKAKFGKTSTSDLTTTELQACYEEMSRHVSQFGIEMSWPAEENSENYIRSFKEN